MNYVMRAGRPRSERAEITEAQRAELARIIETAPVSLGLPLKTEEIARRAAIAFWCAQQLDDPKLARSAGLGQLPPAEHNEMLLSAVVRLAAHQELADAIGPVVKDAVAAVRELKSDGKAEKIADILTRCHALADQFLAPPPRPGTPRVQRSEPPSCSAPALLEKLEKLGGEPRPGGPIVRNAGQFGSISRDREHAVRVDGMRLALTYLIHDEDREALLAGIRGVEAIR